MTKLNDLQSILLSSAVQRDSGSLLPAPESVAGSVDRLGKAIASLTKRGLAEEREANEQRAVYRSDGDLRFGIFITAAGRAAIGVDGEGDASDTVTRIPDKPQRQTKSAAVIALLQREEGATLAELIEATSWLPHTTRAALTGLRKKGHVIEKSKRGEETYYRIVASA
jgi:hypothetical protein